MRAGRIVTALGAVALAGAGLAALAWRSGEQEPIDVVAETQEALGLPLESSRIQTNGIRLHVVQAGPPDGPPVLLLHGFPEFWWTWHVQMRELAEAGFRVIVPDLRGFDLSDKPPRVQDYRIELREADLIGLLDALGHPRVFLAGHDFGAFLAWNLVIDHPDRFRKLVVFNVAHPRAYERPPQGEREQETIRWFRTFAQLPWLPELLLRAWDWSLLERNLRDTARPGTFPEPVLRYYKQAWAEDNAMHTMIHWYRAGFRWPRDFSNAPRVSLPVRIAVGEGDRFIDPRFAEASLEFCDDAAVIRFEKAGHWVLHEEAAATSALLVEFFRNP